jgi:hypothetical protein
MAPGRVCFPVPLHLARLFPNRLLCEATLL